MRWVALVCSAALLAAGCSSGDVFTFAEDDLCERVSEEEVTSFVSEAYGDLGVDWDGTAVAVQPEDDVYACQWESTGGGSVIAGGADWIKFIFPSEVAEVVEFAEIDEPFLPVGQTVSGHPDFDDEVLIENAAFGRLGFWVPSSDEALVLFVDLGGFTHDHNFEIPLFVVANGFLEEMGWTP